MFVTLIIKVQYIGEMLMSALHACICLLRINKKNNLAIHQSLFEQQYINPIQS